VILIALGANLSSPVGAPTETLRAALQTLPHQNVAIEDVSPFYQSAAWPDPRDPEFVNAVARIKTELSPPELLAVLKRTECDFGREVAERNAPRPLDIDILDYERRIESGPPALPHPRLHERAFVLVPLRDVAPGWTHPVSGLSVASLIETLPAAECTLRRLA